MKDEEEKGSLLFPPWRLMGRFLLVTMMLIAGTAFSGITIFSYYMELTLKWQIGILFSTIGVFCIVNFRVTRGSFFCANILKYYALILACVCIPALLIEQDYLFTLFTVFLMLSAFYLISGKTYQKLVQYQHDFFEDIKEAREIVEKEMERANMNKRG
ncbi:hypothetical protein KO527_22070 [Pseudoalteromonas sp. C2R02]|uniref:hypothetical protein n=1 Tax=Pseudoalteromonas sp. C2R02 TaxID=2841565 RepID=UPI001C0960F3|nr:hypothetical protein [Pseudoalteromonas sp. C2R02]MBU2972028.1 hypothetical protein [Pseudoalteromonas sp. C2R02]